MRLRILAISLLVAGAAGLVFPGNLARSLPFTLLIVLAIMLSSEEFEKE